MGGGLAGRAARQHPDLILDAPGWQRPVVLALLTLNGVLSALAGALFLPLYLGTIPFPVSALISGLINLALVWAAQQWTSSTRLAMLPLGAWLLTVAGLTLGGPGNDIVFGGTGIMQLGPLVLLVIGALPPVLWLYRRVPARA
jgi:hypothetical protein